MKIRIEGPYYGSYSLAAVNRSLALALAHIQKHQISISATAAENWHRDVATESALAKEGIQYADCREESSIDVVIRNTWPIEHSNLAKDSFKIRWFAWEESRVPHNIVDGFNQHYDLVLSKSRFVLKSLADSGLYKHLDVLEDASDFVANNANLVTKKHFLHISSCFPRKAPDVMLRAFYNAFDENSDARLTIKTFDNPHNQIDDLIVKLGAEKPGFAKKINLIKRDLGINQMQKLVDSCSYLVLPSRGEGYGLPPLEAHIRNKPVIMPRSSALSERFVAGADIEVDFSPTYARSHVSTVGSIWYEPSINSLSDAFRLASKTLEGGAPVYREKLKILSNTKFKNWSNIATDLDTLLQTYLPRLSSSSLNKVNRPRVCIISSWNQKCGIANYTRELLKVVPLESISEVLILAPKINQNEEILEKNNFDFPMNYQRVWDYWGNVDKQVSERIDQFNPEIILIQHHTGFFAPNILSKIINAQSDKCRITVTLHSVFDYKDSPIGGTYDSLVKKVNSKTNFLVHSLREYKNIPYENVSIFPHGTPDEVEWAELRPLESTYIATSFGYIRRHKGIRELIAIWALVAAELPDARLLLLNSLHPDPDSIEEEEYCRKLIRDLRLEKNIDLKSDYHNLETVKAVIGYSDFCIFNYLPVEEGASGAVREALAAHACTVVSDTPLFDEFTNSVLRIPTSDSITASKIIVNLFLERSLREEYRSRSKDFCKQSSWITVGQTYWLRMLHSSFLPQSTKQVISA